MLELTKRQKESEESTEILWERHKGRRGEDQKKQGKLILTACLF